MVINMKLQCRKCQIIFTIQDPMPSDITALNKAECGSGYGNYIIENGNKIIVHEIRGVL